MARRNIVVLISGSGTNLQALIDACASGEIPDTAISLVFSNRKAAYGLTRAARASPPIPTDYLALQPYLRSHPDKTRENYDEEVAWRVRAKSPDLVVLAGWMHVLSERFLDVMEGKHGESRDNNDTSTTSEARSIPVINLHPALPGAFDGANAIDRALEAFQKGEITETGVMVHKVVKEVDRGEPILVQTIDFRDGEFKDDFEKRLHETEWAIIVAATKKVLEDSLPIHLDTSFQ